MSHLEHYSLDQTSRWIKKQSGSLCSESLRELGHVVLSILSVTWHKQECDLGNFADLPYGGMRSQYVRIHGCCLEGPVFLKIHNKRQNHFSVI